MIYESPRFLYSGDQYLTIEIGDEMTLKANFKVIGLDQAIKEANIEGVIETLPGWRSMLLSYDSLAIHTEHLISELTNVAGRIPEVTQIASRLIELPVYYGGTWGKDLDFVAQQNNVSVEDVIRIHTETVHWVGMVGFTPGSPQLMQLNPRKLLTVPKYVSPRLYTAKGTIAIGGSLTAIYPVPSPGGYQMIGLTPVPIYDRFQSFDIFEESPALLRIGDRVKFIPVDGEGFDQIRQQVWECSYKFSIQPETFSL